MKNKYEYIYTKITENKSNSNIYTIYRLYTYKEALEDLKKYLNKHLPLNCLEKLLPKFDEWRKDKKVPIKYIFREISRCQIENNFLIKNSLEDDELLNDLMSFYG